MSNYYPLFVLLAPLVAAFFTALPNRFVNENNYKVAWGLIFLGFAASLLVLWQSIQSPVPIQFELFSTPWEFLPTVGLTIDRLSAVMMVVISGFGTILYRYSTRYLQQDSGLSRYQTLLALKAGTLLFMVSSGDLLTLFVFWQVSGWFLSLLSHNYAHIPTVNGAFRTFIFLRAGEMAFVGGIVLAYHLYGTVQLAQLFELAATDQTVLSLFGTGLEITGITAITLLIFIGAMSKSAQFPLHMWLPDALYAPTPIHALLHSGGINAGGFLLTRLAPLYILSSTTLHFVLLIGLATAVLGTSMMLVQNDIKKTLGYSTIGQMGYMIMECGVGAFPLAVFHLIAHGLFKADIFLNCGKGIQEAREHPEHPKQDLSGSMFGSIGWVFAFVLSFLAPLGIVIGAHEFLGISLLESQGIFILMLFSWVTASQAMLTLFKLKEPLLTKSMMLIGISVVAIVYFYAAEQFSHFLVPDLALLNAYYAAAELPQGWFLIFVTVLMLSITLGWLYSVCRKKDKSIAHEANGLKTKMYLFLVNRLYLDGFALRVFGSLKRTGSSLNQSPAALIVIALAALVMAYGQITGPFTLSIQSFVWLFVSALLVPLFPFHGLYTAILTKLPTTLGRILCVVMPIMGIYTLKSHISSIPNELLPAISILAVVGAVWGTIKALSQVRIANLLAYGGLALYSIFWLHTAQSGVVSSQALLYGVTVTLVWGGLFFAWDRVRVRYGDLDLNQIGGLFAPMPRFATCMGLLVMAAVGLPPFGLFVGYLGILLSPSTGISYGVIVIIATWFAACWYMFKLMQHLLFGPHRKDLCYEDLRPMEIAVFALVIVLLILPSALSPDVLNVAVTDLLWKAEKIAWIQ